MGRRGRPTKARTSELGLYLEQLRLDKGWSVRDLAREAGVSYKALSKLELDRSLPRQPGAFLWKIADAFGIHANNLLIRASLTPLLRPPKDEVIPPPTELITFTPKVTEKESQELEKYLQYLRFLDSVESVRQKAEKEKD